MADDNSVTTATQDTTDASSVPNSPNVSASGKIRVRAIKDQDQLAALVKKYERENRDRNIKNARIMAKYNSERPRLQKEMDDAGVGWKANISTQPLATLIDRVSPRFPRAVNDARYLTSAALPGFVENAAKKTEKFRFEFTNLVRNHPDWKGLLAEGAQEDALFGYTFIGFTDDTSWFPKHYRQDEFFVPSGTKQGIRHCPLLILKETFLPHELFELVEDNKAADTAGWDVPQTIKSINAATPESIRKGFASNEERQFEDLKRESNLYSSLADGAKVIVAYHAFAVEVTGKVSHYIIDGVSWKMLFERWDRFDSMQELGAFLSFQQANGKLQGSKGVGRTIYTLAGVIDRSRNEVMDRLQLSGKLIIQGDEKAIQKFKMSVIGQAVVISKAFTLVQTKIDAGVEPFMQLDSWVMRLMDEIAGNISPAATQDMLQGERVTNGQVNLVADLANEGKDIKIDRFVMQVGELLSQMQLRACSKKADDDASKEFRARCLEMMSQKELETIAKHPAAATIQDFTDQERQIEISIIDQVLNDPMIQRKEALRRKLTAARNADFAEQLLLPDEDPTIASEQSEKQATESLLMEAGKADAVGISRRDNHILHLDQLMKDAQEIAGQAAQDPKMVDVLGHMVDHGTDHVQAALSQAVPAAQLQPYIAQLQKIHQGIQTVQQSAQVPPTQPNVPPVG